MSPQQSTAATRPDTHDMVVVHRVFRREFQLAPRIIRTVGDGDVERAAELSRHLSDLTTGLHLHHTGEDELLWPVLHERTPMDDALVSLMQHQHARVAELVGRVDDLLERWAETGHFATRDELARVLEQVSQVLGEHLAQEERDILPLARAYLTAQEWEAIGAHAIAGVPKDRLLLFLGSMVRVDDRQFSGLNRLLAEVGRTLDADELPEMFVQNHPVTSALCVGMDKPMTVQYWDWISGMARLDAGNSLWTRRPVLREIGDRLPITLELTILAFMVQLIIAIPIGTMAATHQDSPLDQLSRFFAILFAAAPQFWYRS